MTAEVEERETEFTPGPWKIEMNTGALGESVTIYSEDEDTMPILREQFLSEPDARLIAAAPELYEAAKRAEAWFSTPTEDYPPEEASSDIVDALRNALAKAEGE